MEFQLVYEGPLLARGANGADKGEIRRALHPQLMTGRASTS